MNPFFCTFIILSFFSFNSSLSLSLSLVSYMLSYPPSSFRHSSPPTLKTASWITVNTKECPLCTVSIEKNGGCNHMTCRSCRVRWRWRGWGGKKGRL